MSKKKAVKKEFVLTLKGRVATLPGASHHKQFINRQDQMSYRYGLVDHTQTPIVSFAICDGSSSAHMSEVGAGLMASFLSEVTLSSYLANGLIDIDLFSQIIFMKAYVYMEELIKARPNGRQYLEALDIERVGGPKVPIDRWDMYNVFTFIKETLMFTATIGLLTPDGATILMRGDGGYDVGSQHQMLDYRDYPPYFAYLLMPNHVVEAGMESLRKSEKNIPEYPDTFTAFQYPNASKLAIFSDAFSSSTLGESLSQFWKTVTPVDQWEQYRNNLTKSLHQKWRDGHYADDATIMMFEYVQEVVK